MTSFAALAQTTDIALPDLLQRLLADGLADYGTDVRDWVADWKTHTLAARPVLSCVYDFEWISAADAQESITEWLNPAYQQGRRFLPFAQTGAGDLYCLTPLSAMTAADESAGDIGVALVWHDDDTSAISAASFDAFVFDALVRSATDVSHLTDEGFSAAEAMQCVLTNIQSLAPLLPPAMQAPLEHIAQRITAGDEAAGDALISASTAQAALALLPAVADAPFPVLARWECGED